MRKCSLLLAIAALTIWGGCQNMEEEENANADNANASANENDSGEPEGNDNGGPGGAGGVDPEQGIAELDRFGSAEELEEYFKSQIVSQNSGYAERVGLDDGFFDAEPGAGEEGDAALDADGGATGAEGEGEGEAEGGGLAPPEDGDFSGTTIQEEGVDEADVVKTDGTYLYVITGEELHIASAVTYLYVITGEELHIASAVPADDLQMLGSFRLKGWGRDLYLVGDRAVALTSASAVFYPVGVEVTTEPAEGSGSDAGEQVDSTTLQEIEPSPDVEPWFQWRPQSVVTVIDVSDRSNPALISQTAFDGDIASSRMIGGVLRL
ncbi:MAG: beta-propeller domain-containing protein, partial [Planctomycetota bacterium]